ncbi:MAG TPA: M48 family metalloprotease [Burkholderiales bacterium]|nr:M48 family metalloprotease [Burkholderiales bacterium]
MRKKLALSGAGALFVLTLAVPAVAQFNLDLDKLLDIGRKAAQLREVPPEEEQEIGRGVAANLVGIAPLVPDAGLQRYVNAVGEWLALHTERPELEWRFGVLDTADVNAFATPGGYIFVTRGLLARMDSEAELAGVLAHEMAHVLRRHHLKAIQKNALMGIGVDVASFLAAQKGVQRADRLERVAAVGTELYARGLDRDDELEADRMGVVIAARAGYNAYGLPEVLQALEAINPGDSHAALMFRTHPAPRARLDALDKAMVPELDRYAAQPELAGRFRKVVRDRH